MSAHHPARWFRDGDSADAADGYRALTTAPTLATDGINIHPDNRGVLVSLMVQAAAAGAYSFDVDLYGYKSKTEFISAAGAPTEVAHAASASGWAHIGTLAVSGTTAGCDVHLLEAISAFERVAARASSLVGSPSIWLDFGLSPVEEVR